MQPSSHADGASLVRHTRLTPNALRDETYRSMLRLQAGKSGAISSLCEALIAAWGAASSIKKSEHLEEWLRKVTPICLRMISASTELGNAASFAAQASCQNSKINPKKDSRTNMEVKVIHLDQVRFSIQARNHIIISDQPAESGGQDTGMTPPELLLASLGSCAAFYAAQYLRTRNLAESGVEVSVSAEKLKQPARMGEFRIDVSCPVPLTEDQKQGLLRSVHQCLVHNTLISQPDIAIELIAPELAIAP